MLFKLNNNLNLLFRSFFCPVGSERSGKNAHKKSAPDGDVKRCKNMNLSKAGLFDEKIIGRLAKTENVRLGALGNRPDRIDVHRLVQVDVNLHRSEIRVGKRTDPDPFIS